MRLLNTCGDLLESKNASQNESLLECYNRFEKNLDLLLFGGEYEYAGIEASLTAEKSHLILFELSNFDNNLNKLGQLIGQFYEGTLDANSFNYESIAKLSKQIIGLSEHFDLKSKNTSNLKITYTIFWTLITIGTLVLSVVVFKRNYLVPIHELNEFSDALNRGIYKSDQSSIPNNQFKKLHLNLSKIGDRFLNVIEFIEKIGRGNLELEIEVEGDDDMLGKSLHQLKDELKKVSHEEQKRNWANEGLTKFNDIIYAHNNDVNALAQVLISELVKYVSANQGAIFRIVEEEDEQMLELISTYAWDRKKFVEKKLDLKTNLIGQAVLEREHMHIKNVPEEFVNITSGLGEATPRSIIILPLIFNDVCCGAIELASFKEFDENKISFLIRLSENIASAILNITGNTETKKLLEESQSLTEQLRAQEEELRQNEEELEAAQESLSRKLEEATQEMQLQLNKVEAE
ncbi:MAG: GAF domain-containing protein, partial [Cyclobacteriaceae bacterium]|nr:GAF domain-containing protein [Cyclobacteriaceae bacterium]